VSAYRQVDDRVRNSSTRAEKTSPVIIARHVARRVRSSGKKGGVGGKFRSLSRDSGKKTQPLAYSRREEEKKNKADGDRAAGRLPEPRAKKEIVSGPEPKEERLFS